MVMRRLSGLKLGAGRRISTSSVATGASEGGEVEVNEGDNQGKNDAEKMQRKTFRRWVNKYLKARNMQVNHIINDWENGVLLVNLLEILSKSEFTRYNKTPKMKLHSLENLNACIAFMKANNIPLVNVGSDDVFQHNPTIVMGLIWCLILKYSLNAGKVEVMNWCKKRLEPIGMEVKNFTDDWKDGMLFAAVVSSQFPEQLDLSTCSKSDPIGNMNKAFTVAEQYLEVSRLLDPQDVQKSPDEKSIVAYVGEIYNAIEHPRAAKPLPAPDAPNVEKVTTSSAEISWTPTPGAIKTRVLFKEAGSDDDKDLATWKVFGELPGTDNKCVVDNLKADNAYKFRIVAISPRVESEPSAIVETSTLAQGAPIASDVKPNSFVLTWEPRPNASAYRIETKLAGDDIPWSTATKIETTERQVVLDKLTPATEYESRLVVLSGPDKTPADPSNVCSVRTLMEPPGKPTVSNITDNSFRVQWSPAQKAGRYIVQIKGASDPSWDEDSKTITVDAPQTACDVNYLVPGEAYQVRVIAEAEANGGLSSPSEEETAVTTMVRDRCALVTGADIGSGCKVISRLLEHSSSTTTSWEQGFSAVYVVTEHPSGALLAMARKDPNKVKIITVRAFSDPKAVKDAARELSQMTTYINLCVNYANLRSEILSGLLAEVAGPN